jgi:hypothetical protein
MEPCIWYQRNRGPFPIWCSVIFSRLDKVRTASRAHPTSNSIVARRGQRGQSNGSVKRTNHPQLFPGLSYLHFSISLHVVHRDDLNFAWVENYSKVFFFIECSSCDCGLYRCYFLNETLLQELAGPPVTLWFLWRNVTLNCFMLLMIITVLPRRFYNPPEQKSPYYALTKSRNPVMYNTSPVTSFSG